MEGKLNGGFSLRVFWLGLGMAESDSKKSKEVKDTDDYLDLHDSRPYLHIKEWTVDDLNADEDWLGLTGSPTKVKKVTNVVFTAKESKVLGEKDEEIEELIIELLENHTIG